MNNSESAFTKDNSFPDGNWCFDEHALNNTPSRLDGISESQELGYRQKGAAFIRNLGNRLHFTNETINTAVIYMHRFYMFHSFKRYHRNQLVPAALFLATKLMNTVKSRLVPIVQLSFYMLTNKKLNPNSEEFREQVRLLFSMENLILATLNFDVDIDLPHKRINEFFDTSMKKSNHISQQMKNGSLFMACSVVQYSTLCLRVKPSVVAAICIHMTCGWSRCDIMDETDGKQWFEYFDPTITRQMLDFYAEQVIADFE